MLTIPLEKLAYIVTKAREFDAEVPQVDEDSGSNPSETPSGRCSSSTPTIRPTRN
jgi:hypothetical protein